MSNVSKFRITRLEDRIVPGMMAGMFSGCHTAPSHDCHDNSCNSHDSGSNKGGSNKGGSNKFNN